MGVRPRGRWSADSPLLSAMWVVSVVALAWFAVNLRRPVGPPVLLWLPPVLSTLLATVACWRVGRLPQLRGRPAVFWYALGWSALFVGAGVAAHGRAVVWGAPRPFYDVGVEAASLFAVGSTVVLVAVLRLPAAHPVTAAGILRFAADTGIVAITGGTFLWYFLAPHGKGVHLPGFSGPLLILLLLACVSVCVIAKVGVAGVAGVDAVAIRTVAFSGAVGATGGLVVPLITDRPQLAPSQVAPLLLYLCFGYAARRQARALLSAPVPVPPREPRRPFGVLPYVAVAATDGLLLVTVARDAAEVPVACAAVLLTVIVVGRQVVAFHENARLLRQVDATLLDVREAQRRLAHQASHDSLTGLANRSAFEARVGAAAAGEAPFIVGLIDLDDFKAVNDRLGHHVGDLLLVEVAERLRAGVRGEDVVARLGGDEFAVLAWAEPEDAAGIVERLGAALDRPVRVGGHDLLVRSSTGYADSAPDADPGELLRRADLAMYAAKEAGKGRGVRYDAQLNHRAESDAQLGAELRDALDRGEFHLLYQPLVELPGGAAVGVEALIRWRHPQGRTVPPDQFIGVAERTGLIVPLGRWILHEACRQGMEWLRLDAGRKWAVGVNISARQLREPGFADEVAAALSVSGLPAWRLVVEVTETAVFDNGPAVAALAAISSLGVRVALDDFGTGHSSLGLLRTCPVHVVKVDKSFIRTITADASEAVIATAIIQIANGLGFDAVAEGVETEEQAALLTEMGYRFAQGYLFDRPLPPDEAGRRLTGVAQVGGGGRTAVGLRVET